jgi:uncharacterized iron-regulated membrane protein
VVHDGGRELNVFVDPYSGKVLGEQDGKQNLQAIARALHGELMVGTVGDRLVELAAGWGIVLVVSGLYLWWPRGRSSAGVLWPRLSTRPGVVARPARGHRFLGLGPVAADADQRHDLDRPVGKQYADLWNRFPAAMWNDVPKSDKQAGELNDAHRQTVPWALENTPMPVSGDMPSMPAITWPTRPAAPQVSLQQVEDVATLRQVAPGYSITLPTTADGVFTIAVFADDPRNDATLHVDQYTGKVLADVRWQDYSPVARATELGVMLHEGKMFGPLNQIVILLVCLMILLGSVSGLVMWWKRKPASGRAAAAP